MTSSGVLGTKRTCLEGVQGGGIEGRSVNEKVLEGTLS